jgi:hypothetical protein
MINLNMNLLFYLTAVITATLPSTVQCNSTTTTTTTSSATLSTEYLIEVNSLLRNESFFSNVTARLIQHHQDGAEHHSITVSFTFTASLIDLLRHLNVNLLDVSLRNYVEQDTSPQSPHDQTFEATEHENNASSPANWQDATLATSLGRPLMHETTSVLINDSSTFVNSTYCERSVSLHESISCYKQLKLEKNSISYNDLNDNTNLYVLDTITVPLGHDDEQISYTMCLKLVHNHNRLLYFFSENMCQTWLLTSGDRCRRGCNKSTNGHYKPPPHVEHVLAYKPLFIVLMYALCASVLIPIAIASHFQNRAKAKKLAANKLKLAAAAAKSPSHEPLVIAAATIVEEDEASVVAPLLAVVDDDTVQHQFGQLLAGLTGVVTSSVPSLSSAVSPTSKASSSLFSIPKSLGHAQGMRLDEERSSCEAEHILSNKPWGSRVVSLDSFQVDNENLSYSSPPPPQQRRLQRNTSHSQSRGTVSIGSGKFPIYEMQNIPKRLVFDQTATAAARKSTASSLNRIPPVSTSIGAISSTEMRINMIDRRLTAAGSTTRVSNYKSSMQGSASKPSLRSLDRSKVIFETPV